MRIAAEPERRRSAGLLVALPGVSAASGRSSENAMQVFAIERSGIAARRAPAA
jgi:hypothetical protein